jgi:hypothetical protein
MSNDTVSLDYLILKTDTISSSKSNYLADTDPNLKFAGKNTRTGIYYDLQHSTKHPHFYMAY